MKFQRSEEVEEQIIDKETGEINIIRKTISKTFTQRVSPEEFFMSFVSALAPSLKLSPSETRLLNVLNNRAQYNSGTVPMTGKDRDTICELLGIHKQSLSNALNSLKNKGMLALDRGEWQINPMYFWKGELSVRQQKLSSKEIRLTFSIEDVE